MSNAALRTEVSDLALAISRHKLVLNDMENQLNNLRLQLDSIIYPILTIPPEITTEIFVHCLPASRRLDVVNPEEAPLLLTHVCRDWREIAISTPALWTTLYIEADDRQAHFSAIVKMWLTRTGQCPLSVRINGGLSRIDKFVAFLKTFRRHSPRMRSLELNIDLKGFKKMDTHPLDLPLLEKLSIRLPEMDPDDDSAIEMLFASVPLLHEVLMNVAPPSFIPLPWNQITKFTGQLYTLAECFEALHLMPNMTECAFSMLGHRDPDDLPPPEILQFLILPGLQTLEILGAEDFSEIILDSFLTRSSPPLRKLAIRPLDSEGAIEIDLFSFLTVNGLTDLEIWYPAHHFVSLFFGFFACDKTLLPQLQTLSFSGCRSMDDGSEASLNDILEIAAAPMTQRRTLEGVAKIQSFRVASESRRPFFSEEQIRPFKKLKSEGMQIHVGPETESFV
ncbi:hypothetical protein C8R44DRAFT_890436 [Mycena epipterygia]|nr:hypothetical protein C8R44DRAFT_890436 [Mycena epipterygia]